MNVNQKQKALEIIAREIDQCLICKRGKSGKSVPGEGNPAARVVFIGEAPGKKEAETGRPFIGRSGILLRNLIQKSGLSEKEIFITSPVKYLPNRGTPLKSDIIHGMIHTQEQLKIINPQFVILLGKTATYALLKEDILITKRHGEVLEKDGTKYIVTFHPSAALRFPPLREKLEKDFETIKNLLK